MSIYMDTVEKSRTARCDKNTISCPLEFNKAVTGYITTAQVKYYRQTRTLETSVLSMLFLKTFKDVKFTLDV